MLYQKSRLGRNLIYAPLVGISVVWWENHIFSGRDSRKWVTKCRPFVFQHPTISLECSTYDVISRVISQSGTGWFQIGWKECAQAPPSRVIYIAAAAGAPGSWRVDKSNKQLCPNTYAPIHSNHESYILYTYMNTLYNTLELPKEHDWLDARIPYVALPVHRCCSLS